MRFFKISNIDKKKTHDPTASLVHSLRNFTAAVLYLKRAQLHRGRKQGGAWQPSRQYTYFNSFFYLKILYAQRNEILQNF